MAALYIKVYNVKLCTLVRTEFYSRQFDMWRSGVKSTAKEALQDSYTQLSTDPFPT